MSSTHSWPAQEHHGREWHSYFSNPGSFKSLYSGGEVVSPSQGYWFSVDSIPKEVPGQGCEETAGQILWWVLSKCSISADCPPVPARSSGVNSLPCPNLPLCRNYRDVRACRLPLPLPEREEEAESKPTPSSVFKATAWLCRGPADASWPGLSKPDFQFKGKLSDKHLQVQCCLSCST